MPQLSLNFLFSQLFWLLATISILYFLMARFILPRMSSVLQEREARISGAIKSAQLAKDEAGRIEIDYKSRLSHARKSSTLTIAEMQNSLKKKSKKRLEEAEIGFKDLLKKSDVEIISFKRTADKDLEQVILDSVKLITKQIMELEPSDQKVKELINLDGK